MAGALRTAGATLAYAALHSLLASRSAKGLAARVLGCRGRNGLYRPFFIAQSVLGFAGLAAYTARQPMRVLYDLRGPIAWLLRAAQAGSLAWAMSAAHQVGTRRMLGVPGLRAFIGRDAVVPREPEAQGPAPEPSGDRMQATGPFRFSRHPLNMAPIPLFWLNPRMTTRLAAFAAVATLYFVVGSLHEEHRLRLAYREAYEEYQNSGTRFLLPLPRAAMAGQRRRG